MKRRGFLGFLGGAVAAGPSAVKSAAQLGVDDLIPPASLPGDGTNAAMPMGGAVRERPIEWAKNRLKQLADETPQAMERRRRMTSVHRFPADIAVLRSVSIGTKLRMAREEVFRQSTQGERNYLDGIINGWWD